jgi:hypothetical protein
MKWVGLLAAAALLLGASAPAASADSTAPLTGAEAICLQQGGTWHPSGFPTFEHPLCADLDLIVLQDPGSSARNQLTAANRLCIAAGFLGARTFGKGIVDEEGRPAFLVVQWACV